MDDSILSKHLHHRPRNARYDFRAQADQLLRIIESRLAAQQRASALEFLVLKFKALYEQGVLNGRLYETDGIYPFNSLEEDSEDHH